MAKQTATIKSKKRATKTTNSVRETTKTEKETLFEDFYATAASMFSETERLFNVDGLCNQVFGREFPGNFVDDESDSKERLRSTFAWTVLSNVYDYAVEGLDRDGEAMSLVLDSGLLLSLLHNDEHHVSEKWGDIIAMGDGRYAIEEGMPIDHYKVALLANVDLRTVRNAISAGELAAFKQDEFLFIENTSARNWLHGRKGFRPTIQQHPTYFSDLSEVKSPLQFGAFLRRQREKLGLDDADNKLVVRHPNVLPADLARMEAGVFTLPIDTVFPLADFYQIGRKVFLEAVMRIFFQAELDLLQGGH
jgi:hypothetical protein